MIFHQFEAKGLAHFSYLVGCKNGGVAAIIDPKRDIDTYIQFARSQNLKITKILETHIHADYASGAKELAHATGGTLILSRYDKGEMFEVKFPHQEIQDGESVLLGKVRLVALHTPGHTPEHLSFLVFDESRSSKTPLMLLTGDFLFVGSLGRPDLLGEDAKKILVEKLYDTSHRKITSLPDSLELYPAHGAGSMCGAGMSALSHSTLGYERACNPYLQQELNLESFRAKIFANTPPFPEYYKMMKKINSEGPKILDTLPGQEPIEPSEFKRLWESGHTVIDLRDQVSFGEGHIPRSFGIGHGPSLSTWASWMVPYDTPILLVTPGEDTVEEASRYLIRVGLDDIRGYLSGGIESWKNEGFPISLTRQVRPEDLKKKLDAGSKIRALDVRSAQEFSSGHIKGAINIPCHELPHRLEEAKASRAALALICGSGYRSTVGASILERAGISEVMNITGGMLAWERAHLPMTT